MAFAVGTKIKHPIYGIGMITRIGTRLPEHYYDADFSGRGGNGAKVWLPKKKTERVCKVLN